MSLGRHAYRHATSSSSSSSSSSIPLIGDHVWISDDFLATTLRCFAHGQRQQRRYESCVPGPLEARRRLAKRRNTALASIAGAGPFGDISCLFGKNGREHMKWTDRKMEIGDPGMQSHQLAPPDTSLPFYDKSNSPGEFSGWPVDPVVTDKDARDKYLEEYLEGNWTTTAVKEITGQLNINLQYEPAYSRKIFNHLLAKSVHTRAVDETLFLFLDDLTLNIRGAGNFAAAVEHLASHETRSSNRRNCLRAIFRAVELGLLPPDELRAIVKTIPQIQSGSVDKNMARCYRPLWDAIGRCEVFGHRDLDAETVGAWLGILEQENSPEAMDLAKEIIQGTQSPESSGCPWVPVFITHWLDLEIKSACNADFVTGLLDHFNSDVVSDYIVHVTESLASSSRNRHRSLLLERWRDCLSELQDVGPLVCSPTWLDVDAQNAIMSNRVGLEECTGLSQDHRIILRLWALRTLSKSLPEGPLWRRRRRQTDSPMLHLFDLYESQTNGEDLLSSFMKGIHAMDIPFNGLLMLAVDLRIQKNMTKARRGALQQLERTRVPLADVFADLDTYNTTKPLLFPAYEKMVCQVDITSAAFIEHSVNLAKTGDTKSVWTLIRLFRSHTPLKISLSGSWHRDPTPENSTSTSNPHPNDNNNNNNPSKSSAFPDPHTALELIHMLAITLSNSQTLSPSRSFHLIHWLYTFLMRHNAPVKPVLVRAMYHAGIVRYQRQGRRVATTRYLYIFELVKKFEDPVVARELMQGPQIGESRNGIKVT